MKDILENISFRILKKWKEMKVSRDGTSSDDYSGHKNWIKCN